MLILWYFFGSLEAMNNQRQTIDIPTTTHRHTKENQRTTEDIPKKSNKIPQKRPKPGILLAKNVILWNIFVVFCDFPEYWPFF